MPIPLGILALAGVGGAAGAYDLLQTTLISTNTTSVSFSSLGAYSAYKHLQLRITAKSDTTTDNLLVTLNSDTGTNYARHTLFGNGTAAGVLAASAAANISLDNGLAQTATANSFAATVIDILDFSSTSKNTTLRAFSGRSETNPWIALNSGLWNNTAAVTTITLSIAAGSNIVSGSRFSLYGVR